MKNHPLNRSFFTVALIFIFSLSITVEEIDWERAKTLRQKMKSGESLSEADSAFLKKAIAARTGPPSTRSNSTRGDGSDEKATVAPVVVSEEDSPVKTLKAKASDGNEIEFAYRVPKADRPLPAIVFIHGSLGQSRIRELVTSARTNPTHTRFLAAGYVAVAATFRTYVEEPLSRGPVLDLIAIVEEVKKLPEVDPDSVVIFGATVLYTGLMTDLSMRDRSMKEYPTLYTEERRKATEAKIAGISCPLLVHHGDVHLLKNINSDIVFPAIEEAGKTLIVKRYPGEDHGFYWGNRTSEATVNLVVANTREFIEPLLKTKPLGQ